MPDSECRLKEKIKAIKKLHWSYYIKYATIDASIAPTIITTRKMDTILIVFSFILLHLSIIINENKHKIKNLTYNSLGDKMKLKIKKDKLLGQKRMYLFLFAIMIVGLMIGLIFPMVLSNENQELLKTSISTFFNNVMNHEINYQNGLQNALLSNALFLIGVWLLGISVIGLPIVVFLLFYKSFVFGFSISSILSVYGIKGFPAMITYIFPGTVLSLITTLLLSFYSISFSIKLFRYLFLKENLNFKKIMSKYIKIFAICLVSYLIVSLLDVYFSPIFMNLFTFLLK